MRRSSRVRKAPEKLLDTYKIYSESIQESIENYEADEAEYGDLMQYASDAENEESSDDSASEESSDEESSDSDISDYDSDTGEKLVGDARHAKNKKRVIHNIVEVELQIKDLSSVKEHLEDVRQQHLDAIEKLERGEKLDEDSDSSDGGDSDDDKTTVNGGGDEHMIDVDHDSGNEDNGDDDKDDDASVGSSSSSSSSSDEDEFEVDYTVKDDDKDDEDVEVVVGGLLDTLISKIEGEQGVPAKRVHKKAVKKSIFDDERLYGDHEVEDKSGQDDVQVKAKDLKKIDNKIHRKQRELKESFNEPDLEDLVDDEVKEIEFDTVDTSRFDHRTHAELVLMYQTLQHQYDELYEKVQVLKAGNTSLAKIIREKQFKKDSDDEDDEDDDDETKSIKEEILEDHRQLMETIPEEIRPPDDDVIMRGYMDLLGGRDLLEVQEDVRRLLKREHSDDSLGGDHKRQRTGARIGKKNSTLVGVVVGKGDSARHFNSMSNKKIGIAYEGTAKVGGNRLAIFMSTGGGKKWLQSHFTTKPVPKNITKLY